MADLNFFSWLRRGLGTGLQDAAAGAGATEIAVDVGTNVETVTVSLPVVGPGDIAGIDPRMIVKVHPGRDESDAEFDQFPAIEIDQPDLPWRYTPAKAPLNTAPADHLAPWLVLIVLEDGEIQDRTPPGPDRRLALVTVASVATSLPNLANSWAWAHVQASETPLTPTLAGIPGRVIARILCPRKLKQQTAYNAFLVPAFERGRRAGAGEPLAPSLPPQPNDPPSEVLALTPAWDTNVGGSVTLPVYYEWRFITGFDDLVKRVKPARLPDTVGRRRLDVSAPGYGLPTAVAPPVPPPVPPVPLDTALPIEGALQSIPASQLKRPPVSTAFIDELRNFLDSGQRSFTGLGLKRVVVPPLYGQWPAAIAGLGKPPAPLPANPPWVVDLNTDPRDRAAAALGTAVVQANQEALMSGAWQQVGNLRAVNDELRITQVGREVFTTAFNRHVMRGRLASILNLTGPLFGQVKVSQTQTAFAQVAAGVAGRDLFDPQWRRLSAPRGPLGRRLGFMTNPITGPGAIERINSGSIKPAPEPRTPVGLATAADAFRSIVPGELTPARITTLVGRGTDQLLFWGILFFCVGRKLLIGPASPTWTWWWLLRLVRFGIELIRLAAGRASTDFRVALRDNALTPTLVNGLPKVSGFTATDDVPGTLDPIPTPASPDSPAATRFHTALTELLNDPDLQRLPFPTPVVVDFNALRILLSTKLHPGVTLVASLAKRIKFTPEVTPADQLEPLIIGPEFLQAMWAPLRDRSQEWIVPGLSQVATDTLGLLVPNQRFIEAYMVGLNHEMARELLWNEYPSDQRATAFRQFWDTAPYVKTAGESTANPDPDTLPDGFRDIKPIHKWKTTQLGKNTDRRRDPATTVVLLLRAELVHRFPNVVVYAVPARSDGTFPADPDLAGEIFPVYGGRLGLDSAYYGFELSVADARGTSPRWFFVLQEQPAEPRFHVPEEITNTIEPGDFLLPGNVALQPDGAASFAFATFREPIRVAVPARALVPEN
jgi:hypothetical protein